MPTSGRSERGSSARRCCAPRSSACCRGTALWRSGFLWVGWTGALWLLFLFADGTYRWVSFGSSPFRLKISMKKSPEEFFILLYRFPSMRNDSAKQIRFSSVPNLWHQDERKSEQPRFARPSTQFRTLPPWGENATQSLPVILHGRSGTRPGHLLLVRKVGRKFSRSVQVRRGGVRAHRPRQTVRPRRELRPGQRRPGRAREPGEPAEFERREPPQGDNANGRCCRDRRCYWRPASSTSSRRRNTAAAAGHAHVSGAATAVGIVRFLLFCPPRVSTASSES